MNENIIGIAQFLVARVPDSAETVQVVSFDIEQDAQHFVIDLGLQLLRECLVQPGEFRPVYACNSRQEPTIRANERFRRYRVR